VSERLRRIRADRRWIPAVLAGTLAVSLVAACGGGDHAETADDGRLRLVWGTQTADVPELLKASGLFEDLPYELDIPVISGPAQQLQALYSKRIDVGWTGAATAAVELANAPQDWNETGAPALQAIAVANYPESEYPSPALFVRTDRGINGIEDLRGKSIAYNFGGNIYAAYVVLLSQAGLTPEDVKPAQFADNPAAASAFVAGEVDAVVASFEAVKPLLDSGEARYMPGDPALHTITGGGSSVTRPDVLADPAKLAALEDLYGRLHTYYTEWYPNNEDAVVEVYRRTLNQSPERAKIKFEAAKNTRFFKLSDPDLLANQQLVVTLSHKIGGVKNDRKIDIAYNPILDPITDPET
jgi:sulfonate transport system substrate-binding protein